MTDPAVVADLAPTGVLRASINLGNPVLAQGTSDKPTGVTVDLAREIAARLGVPVSFACFDAARKSLAALTAGAADVAFLAIEPAREAEVSFTAPYVIIEGVYAVPDRSPITTASEVDRPGVRVGVNEGSAYDLFLSRTLTHAQVVRGADGFDVFREQGLEAGGGNPAAAISARRQPAGATAGRAALHADPPGGRHHEEPDGRGHRVPEGVRRDGEGQRVRRGRTGPLGSGRDGRPAIVSVPAVRTRRRAGQWAGVVVADLVDALGELPAVRGALVAVVVDGVVQV